MQFYELTIPTRWRLAPDADDLPLRVRESNRAWAEQRVPDIWQADADGLTLGGRSLELPLPSQRILRMDAHRRGRRSGSVYLRLDGQLAEVALLLGGDSAEIERGLVDNLNRALAASDWGLPATLAVDPASLKYRPLLVVVPSPQPIMLSDLPHLREMLLALTSHFLAGLTNTAEAA